MPQMYFAPTTRTQSPSLRDEIREFTNLILESKIKQHIAEQEQLEKEQERKTKLEDELTLAREKSKIQTPTETALSKVYEAYAQQLTGGGGENLPELEGLTGIGKLRFKQPSELTAAQALAEEKNKIAIAEAIRKGEVTPEGQSTIKFPYRESPEIGEFTRSQGYQPEAFSDVIQNLPAAPTSWEQVPLGLKIKAAFTGGPTAEEKFLGGLRPGGIFKPPAAVKPGEIVGRFTGGTTAPAPQQYSPEIEQDIKDNMEEYKKSREEIIAAMKAKGLIQ